jgi:hypothetical protein
MIQLATQPLPDDDQLGMPPETTNESPLDPIGRAERVLAADA